MDTITNSPEVAYFLTGFVIFTILTFAIEIIIRSRGISEIETLSNKARSRGISEYDLFMEAASEWKVNKNQVDMDFKHYLRDGSIPFYLRHLLRAEKGLGKL